MKKILIVAEFFAPNNKIASVRTTKLAKYFKLNGYYVGVISRKLRNTESIDPTLLKELNYVDEHIIVGDSWIMRQVFWIYNKLKKTEVRKKTINNTTFKPNETNISAVLSPFFRKISSDFYNFYTTKAYSKRAKKQVEKTCRQYDVILTSSGPFSADILGRLAKITNPNILWIADFRDPPPTDFLLKKHLPYYNWLQNEVVKNASAIIGVSDSCIECFKDGFKREIITICNGFDEDDINNIETINGNEFALTYAGMLYNGERDLSIIFKAISELIMESKIDKTKIVVNYLGNDVVSFLEQADAYNMQTICQTFGKVDREKSLQMQLSSHILLLASWNKTGNTGIITGKFFEYMMINKPIVCSIMGNLPNSMLKEMITEANNGVVWEQANDETDYPIMKEYILKQYKQYEQGLPLHFTPNEKYINQFRYKKIANKFIEIINFISR